MTIQTDSGNTYSHLCQTNQIVAGTVNEQVEWDFFPLSAFTSMPELNMFILGVTEQCNLRCSYCCYSGSYQNNRTHSTKGMSEADIDEIFEFILRMTDNRPLHIAFYGGEPVLKFPLIQYAIESGKKLFREVAFSITTNATLLTPDKIDWLISNHVELQISLDGTRFYHDMHRLHPNGTGSFEEVYDVLRDVKQTHHDSLSLVTLQMTLASYRDIEKIAEEWNNDPVLHDYEPNSIHGLAPNFSQGVVRAEFETTKEFYKHLLELYQQHSDWAVLKVFFEERIDRWKNRPIVDTEFRIPLSTCMPVNTKLYIDSNKAIGVCEKMADVYRIGKVNAGVDWAVANNVVSQYYHKRVNRCKHCPAIHMCNLCLTAIEYTDEQWDLLCHNEQVYTQVFFWVFCEMAERGMIS